MGIANIINNSTTTSGGEIIRELVNASDGAGLHFDGSAGALNFTPPDFGSKFSFEFVIKADSYVDPVIKIIDFGVSGNAGRFAFGTAAATSYNLGIYDNSNWVSFGVKVLDDLKVHHICVTIDSTTATLFDNGNQVATATISASHNIDATNDAAIAAFYAGSANFFEGTIYRARFYNRTLSADDVRTAYERADVDYSSQYGSQTSLVDAGASVFTSGTYSWSAYGSNTIANVGNALEITYVNHAYGASNGLRDSSDLTTDLTVGKKYRLTVDAKYTGGSAGSKLQLSLAGSNTDFATLTTSLVTYTYEFTTDTAAGGGLRMSGMSAGNVVTIDNWYLREIGCVSDYDLAFANPTQSLTVQDRAGAADGTASATGVTQVQPVVQGNLTSLAVSSATARTPADGEVVADTVSVTGTGHDAAKITITNTASANARLLLNSGHGNWSVCNSDTVGDALEFRDETANATRLTIDSSGNVSVNASGADQKRTLNVHGTNGASELYTFAIEADGENAKTNFKVGSGGGAAATKLAIDSSGNIEQHTDSNGIVKFGVKNESTGTSARAMVNVLSDGGNLDLSMNGSNYTGVTGWADSGVVSTGSTASGGLKMNAVAGGLALQTNQTTRLSIANSTGLATFNNGIAFSQTNTTATGATDTGTTLDHYEEGTFLPNVGGNATYTSREGRYTRVGRLVTCTFDMTISAIGTGSTNIVSGLPFATGDSIGAGGNVNYYSGLALSPVLFAPTVSGSGVQIRSATSAATSPSNHAILGDGSRVACVATYTV